MSSARSGAGEGADILVSLAGGVATVVFNRPHVRNALTLAMWGRLRPLMHELGADAAVRAVVLRGAGTEAFASGADISEFRQVLKDAGLPGETAAALRRRLARPNSSPVCGLATPGLKSRTRTPASSASVTDRLSA